MISVAVCMRISPLLQTGLKLVDVANFFKRKAIVDEIKKKPQQTSPVPPRQHDV